LTYLALNERANQGAWQLIARGVGREDVIGIMMDRTQDLITVMFSVLKAGAAYLPLDPEYPPAHLGQMLENSGAGMLVTNSLPREGPPTGFAGFAGECLELDRLSTAAASKADPPAVNKPENLAYIIYTSGSTGKPKGVMIEHRNVIAYVHSAQELLHLTPGDTKTQHSSFSFDQFVEEVYPVLFVGGRLVILDKYQLSDPQELRRIFINHGVTVFNTTPALLNQINQSALSLAGHLKTIIVGGDVLKSRYISNIFPQVNLYNFYGPTETTVCATHHLCTGAEDEGEQIPIGKPKANYLLYVLDSHLQPLPPGVPGEILIAGPGVGRGYLNAPEITADKFLDNPFHPGMRMYRTGDLGRWRQDGSLQFIARKDRQVKIRGYRIELTEIEKGLLGYPEIKDAVVIAREQGEDKVLCAYYVRTAENRTETEEDENRDSHVTPLKQHLARLLPDFMIPAFFTQLPEIPRTAAGKADLHRLPQPTVTAGNQYLAPTSPLEEKLVEIWAEVLSLEKEKISIQRSFFELGGHSLKAVALTAKIHKSLHVKIPLVDLFETQTVKELALYIQEANPRQYSPIKKIAQRDDYELSYSQRFFLKSTVYSAPMAFLLEGNFDKKAFQNALLTLLERNEVLRTLYPSGNGLTRQKIVAVAEMNFILEEIDLIGESENSSQIKDLFDKDLYTPYNMSSGPLVRAKLIRLAEKKYLFSLITHHIMVDGTSNLLLSKELTILYAAYAAGEENPLPPLPLQYKDYAAWQIEQVQSGAYRAHRQYWLELFSGGIPRLNLATDFPRPAVKTWAGGSTAFYLNQELSDGIFAITRLQKTTFYICLLAVATALLFKYTGQKDIVVGTWSAGRQREEISQLIGNFLNPFALRMKFSPADQFIDFVQKVKQAALSALEHQDYPLLEISRELQLQEDPARAVYGLFDVMIKVYNFDVPMKNDIRRLEDLTISHYPVDFPICKRDLDFDFFDVNGKIEGNIKYSTQLYKHETILRLKNHFIKIVEQVTLNNKIKLQDLSLTE
jgi:amino acid adenylation domain-containing protein